jgi:XTP/dITP diphosphohydrolase
VGNFALDLATLPENPPPSLQIVPRVADRDNIAGDILPHPLSLSRSVRSRDRAVNFRIPLELAKIRPDAQTQLNSLSMGSDRAIRRVRIRGSESYPRRRDRIAIQTPATPQNQAKNDEIAIATQAKIWQKLAIALTIEKVFHEFSMSSPSVSSQTILDALNRLVAVVAQLRSPDGGCPWDLAQTAETLIPYVIEEAYEVVDAIRSSDSDAIAEELGDLLLQVVLQAQVASDNNQFTLKEVADGIAEKLIRRHPHVFGDLEVENAEEVHIHWEQIKAQEKGETLEQTQRLSRKLKRYARSLPPLLASMKMSQKAAAAGFEWENSDGVWEKFNEELLEFKEALATENKAHQQAELGDLLFTLVNIARWYDLDPSAALQGTNQRFVQRLEAMEAVCDRPLTDCTIEELESMWQQAKIKLAQSSK